MSYAPINTKGAYLNTTEVFPHDDQQFIIKLNSVYTDIANAVNNREISVYEDTQQVPTGSKYSAPVPPGGPIKKRNSFRKTFYFGAIVAGATLNIAHGSTIIECTRIYGTCITTVPDFRPIPYVSTLALNEQISILVDATNIVIINGAGGPNITSGKVVIEYFLN